ncbi:hypothetical protein STRNTR1_1323 [Stenotrophomonas maltophilia]|nr:hypothetical protein STRNTR1_1323 [Stenotrophomonas maltophilia]
MISTGSAYPSPPLGRLTHCTPSLPRRIQADHAGTQPRGPPITGRITPLM